MSRRGETITKMTNLLQKFFTQEIQTPEPTPKQAPPVETVFKYNSMAGESNYYYVPWGKHAGSLRRGKAPPLISKKRNKDADFELVQIAEGKFKYQLKK